jgi:rod shape determining protein RodA
VAVGLAFLASASYRSGEMGQGRYLDFLRRQLVWVALGLLAFIFCAAIRYNWFVSNAYTLYLLCTLGIIATFFFPGRAQRWLRFGSISVQPSEFMKIALVLALAKYVTHVKNFRTLPRVLVSLGLVALPMGLIVLQPDLGTAALLLPVLFAVLFVAGARRRHLLAIAGLILVSGVIGFLMLPKHDYRRQRVATFLRQNLLTEEERLASGYQLEQSKIAVGSGGLRGKGWGKGTQNRLNYLPERHTDFIFAVIAEEGGFIAAAFLLLIYFLLFTSALSIAGRTRDSSGRVFVVGAVALLFTQVFINAGMTVGLAPITGLTLPLVSYGGSSLLSSMIALGLIFNIGMRRIRVLAQDDFNE